MEASHPRPGAPTGVPAPPAAVSASQNRVGTLSYPAPDPHVQIGFETEKLFNISQWLFDSVFLQVRRKDAQAVMNVWAPVLVKIFHLKEMKICTEQVQHC